MPSQKEISLPTIHFQVLLLLVSGRVTAAGNFCRTQKNVACSTLTLMQRSSVLSQGFSTTAATNDMFGFSSTMVGLQSHLGWKNHGFSTWVLIKRSFFKNIIFQGHSLYFKMLLISFSEGRKVTHFLKWFVSHPCSAACFSSVLIHE